MSYTFYDVAYEILQQSDASLSINEIWEKAVELGLDQKIGTSGKTPEKTLAARIYVDIKNNSDTQFVQVNKRPAKFILKNKTAYTINQEIIKTSMDENKKEKRQKFNERELHILLSTFVYSDPRFKCFTKTIYHETSKRNKKGYNEWLHPDLVGVYFPFDQYENNTLKLLEALKENPYRLYAFEMKINLNFSNLREYYFQAVSNSSWANEGYLVTLEMDEDGDLLDELRRLNNAFGIGVIKLDPIHIEQSEVVLQARTKEYLDWNTIDRLTSENLNFNHFIVELMEDIKVGKAKSKYDNILETEVELKEYVVNKGISEKL